MYPSNMYSYNNYSRSCRSTTSLPQLNYSQTRFQGGYDGGCGHVRRRSVSFSRDVCYARRNGLDNDCGYPRRNSCYETMNDYDEFGCNYNMCCPPPEYPCSDPCCQQFKEQKFSDIVVPAFLAKDCSKPCSCGDQCKPKLKPIECCLSKEQIACFCKICQLECSPKPPCFLVLPMSSEPWENQKNNGQTQKKTGTALPRTEANRFNNKKRSLSQAPTATMRAPAGASSRRGSGRKSNLPSRSSYSSSDKSSGLAKNSKSDSSAARRGSKTSVKSNKSDEKAAAAEDPNQVLTDNVMSAYADYKQSCCDCARYNPLRVCACNSESDGQNQQQQQQQHQQQQQPNEEILQQQSQALQQQQQQQQQPNDLYCCMGYQGQPLCCSYTPSSKNPEGLDTNININDKGNTEDCGCCKGNCLCMIKSSRPKKNDNDNNAGSKPDNTCNNNNAGNQNQNLNCNGCSSLCCPYYGCSRCYPPQCCMYHYYRWMRGGYCWPCYNYCCAQYNAYTGQQQSSHHGLPANGTYQNSPEIKKSNQSLRKQGGGALCGEYPVQQEYQFPTIYTGNPMGLKFEVNAPFMPWKKSVACPSGGYVAYGNNHINTFSNA